MLAQGPAWVKAQGFGLPLDRLWDEKAGGGLLANAVQLPGCSGSFVSAEGLLITNHHCAVGILQEHSTPQANLSRDGYLARTRAEEKKAGAYRIQVPRAFRDVTAEVLAAVPAGASDLARFQAVEAKQKALVAECERKPDTRCQFASFDGGLFFTLTEFEEVKDVRLVYAPPLGVGNYGGETDNWSWPRHTGRLLAAAGVQGRRALPSPVLLPGLDEGRARRRRGRRPRLPRPLLPVVDRRRDEGARGALLPGGAGPQRRVDPDPGGGGRAVAGGRDRGGRRAARAREHAEERRGPDRGPAAGPDRREAAGGGRARPGLGGEAAGREGGPRGVRRPRAKLARGVAPHVGAGLPARPPLPRPAGAAVAGLPGPARRRRA